MKNRDSRLYANKIDYMMDTNEASDVFSGHNKYQTILFILIFIFVMILIICLFGKFLGLNSHFQKILATVNKITASIKHFCQQHFQLLHKQLLLLMVMLNYT